MGNTKSKIGKNFTKSKGIIVFHLFIFNVNTIFNKNYLISLVFRQLYTYISLITKFNSMILDKLWY